MSDIINVVVIDPPFDPITIVVDEPAFDPVLVNITNPEGPPGPPGPAGPTGATSSGYQHVQGIPSTLWVISHNLGFFPNVTIIDTDQSELEADIFYIDLNTIQIVLPVALPGSAYMS